jgi:hypothetical protein
MDSLCVLRELPIPTYDILGQLIYINFLINILSNIKLGSRMPS